jgi:hypothetical protein
MEEKIKKFLEFNWRDSAEWQSYFSNIFPTPPGNKVEHYKKKFYKLKIDPDFEISWDVSQNGQSGTTNTTNTNTTSTNQNSRASFPNTFYASPVNTQTSILLSYVEASLWVGFMISIVPQYHTLKFAALALLIRVYRRVGFPRLSMEFAQQLFLDEHFQLLLYALLFLIDRFNLFVLVPLCMTALLNLSEIMKAASNPIFRFLTPYCDKLLNKRVEFALMRSNVEIAIGFLLFVGIFLGLNSFLTPLFYWQYLRFKYIINNDTKTSFGNVNGYINAIKTNANVPGGLKFVLEKIQQFGEYMGRTEPTGNQGAGGQNCIIF